MELTNVALGPSSVSRLSQAREVAQKLEAAFLSEMLKSSGLGKAPDGFGGGAGEDQFTSFLRDAQSREMVKAGGIGLAEVFEAQLTESEKQ